MREFKADLARGERAQVEAMAQRWQGVERRLQSQIDALALEMTNIARDGGTVSQGMLSTNVRYRELMGQLVDELEGYTDYAERTIEQRQAQLARLGIQHAEQAITVQGIGAGFNKLPVSAVQNMVGLTGAGTPLRTLLEASWPLSAQRLTDELISGVALGYNPRKTARNMAQGMGSSQQRMEVIARTEQLRTYREASRQSYVRSGVVTGYKRLCTHDRRVCAACLMDEGHLYALDEEMPEHPQGRCVAIPIVQGVPEPTWVKGEEWFATQDAATQREILGKERYEAWKGGQFALDELVTVKPNAVWGPSLQVTPMRDLAGQGGRRAIEVPVQESRVVTLRRNLTGKIETYANEIDSIDAGIASAKAQYKEAGDRYEKAKDLSREEMNRLRDLVNYELPTRIKQFEEQRATVSAQMRGVVLQELQLPVDKRANVILHLDNIKSKATKEAYRRTTEEASDFVNRITAVNQFPNNKFNVAIMPNKTGRASATPGIINMSSKDTVRTVIHEIGHNVETKRGAIGRVERVAFFDSRTSGDRLQRLSSLMPELRYGSDEVAKKDKWYHPYIGKVYSSDSDRDPSSEIISMGLDTLYAEPHKLVRDDPDYFDFLISYLQGE